MKEYLYVTLEQSQEWHNYLSKFGSTPESLVVEFDNGVKITILATGGQVVVSGIYFDGEIMALHGKYSKMCLVAGFELTDMYDEYNIQVEIVK
jgi:hypothetical protein